MDDVFILNENDTDAARSGLLRLHDAAGHREPSRSEVPLSPEELLSRLRTADPTRNAACLPWLLRTYAAGGYRLEDLPRAHDTLAAFARLRGQLPNTATIDGETRNPRKLGSHVTLASLWSVIAPLVEAERLAQEEEAGEQVDTDRERALSQSRVIHRSNRMVVAVPMTEEASCWWGQGTQWCTAAQKNNAFEHYHTKAPLIVVCLRKISVLPARKLQLHIHADDMQFMDENDARVSPELVSERWQDLEALLYWAVGMNGEALSFIPIPLRTEAMCITAVGEYGRALEHVPERLRTEDMCLAAIRQNGKALEHVPEPLRTEDMCLAAIRQNGKALEHVPEPLRTEAICLTAVKQDGIALAYIPKPLRTEAICTSAVEKDGGALAYVPEPLRTEAVCITAIGRNGRALEYVPELLRTEAICTVAVTQYGHTLYYVPMPLRTEVICLAAVGSNGRALVCVPELLRTEAICLAAVTQNGWALYCVPESLRTKAICTAAVEQNGLALRFVPWALRTEEICTAAVVRNGGTLEYVPQHLRTEVMRLIAVAKEEQKFASVSGETNKRESHDLVLESLEDYLNNSQPNHQNTAPSVKEGML